MKYVKLFEDYKREVNIDNNLLDSISKEIKTAINPTDKDILVAMSNLLNKSLPYLSVPNKNVFSFKCCSLKTTSEKGD